MTGCGVAIVDYGLGNLASVARALRYLGADPFVTASASELMAAPRAVLPGVGAFGTAVRNLRERGLVAPLREFAASGRPFLGICLGMQILMDESEEGGMHSGLGLIPGRVVRFPEQSGVKVPRIGWSGLEPAANWSGTVLSGLSAGDALYFVHSYCVEPADAAAAIAWTIYGSHRYCAVIRHRNLVGCQAHPEKSSVAGLRLLENFLASPGS